MIAGPYIIKRAKSYVALTTMRTLQDRLDTFESYQEYLAFSRRMPFDLELKIKHQLEPFGIFSQRLYDLTYFLINTYHQILNEI